MDAENAARQAERSAAAAQNAPEHRIPFATLVLAIASIGVWLAASLLLWLAGNDMDGSGADRWIYEPAVIGLSLGLAGILWFAAIYFREDAAGENLSHRLRSAIAGSIVIVFVLLVVDLLTLTDFRVALEDIDAILAETGSDVDAQTAGDIAARSVSFVENLLDAFKTVVITIVGFYFAAGAVEAVADKVKESRQTEAIAGIESAEVMKQAAEINKDAAVINRETAGGPPGG